MNFLVRDTRRSLGTLFARSRGRASLLLPGIAGGMAIAVGIAVLFGWALSHEGLKRLGSSYVAMNPATAVCFMFAGIFLALQSQRHRSLWSPVLACVVLSVGTIKLFDLAAGTESGIDRVIFAGRLTGSGALNANPMAPNTAFSFLLLGAAMLLLGREQRWFRAVSHALTLLVVLLSMTSTIGYAYGAVGLYGIRTYIPMALNTAVTFLVISAGLLSTNPGYGVMSIVTSPFMGGATARRLLPYIVGIPFTLGFVWLYGVRWNLFGPIHGIAMFVIANICVLVGIMVSTAKRLDKTAEALVVRTKALEEANTVADAASRAKSNFLANMSHEIRTPMNGVLGMLEILGHTPLNDDQNRIVGTVRSSARMLLEIINDILDFSKIEAGQLKIEDVPSDIADVVESTTRLFLGAAAAKGITLRCFVAASVRGTFLIDPLRLRQVLANLVSNAIKFTAFGGVTITADVLRTEAGGPSLRLVVADTGIGISSEAQARLFQPFEQADGSTARRFGGTGLGLSICLRLMELMKGNIELKSIEGEGTEIRLILPPVPAEVEKENPPKTLRGINVLLATADVAEGNYLAEYIAHWGAHVTVVPCAFRVDTTDKQFTLFLAPAAAEKEVRQAVEARENSCLTTPNRFVFYTFGDQPTDHRSPENDAITTTALSRARLVTAVALAAGRLSPEVEIVARRLGVEGPAIPLDREAALLNGRLILLVEDHPLNRDVVVRQLHLLGYAVDTAENGVFALSALAQFRYGAILTDCSMPEMDGFELTRHIRTTASEYWDTPIIALTANAMAGESKKCFAAGMTDYLVKPVEMKALRHCLERHLPCLGFMIGDERFSPPQERLDREPEVLDISLLAECFFNDKKAVRENLELFLAAMSADLSALSSAIAKRDKRGTGLIAHRLKGSARFVGGTKVALSTEVIESSAASENWATIQEEWPQLIKASNEIHEHIARRIA
jgi:signal transduction histidine kinase/CheY-like chemotaxis protein/HPt (histidine-containing phosphotransfer) domain-containing protein